jgi:hypothetical protein
MIYRRFSTACLQYMQMLQTIVYEDPIPSRLFVTEPPLHTYCGTCMKIRFAAPSLFRGFDQRLGILVLLPYSKSPPPEHRAELEA